MKRRTQFIVSAAVIGMLTIPSVGFAEEKKAKTSMENKVVKAKPLSNHVKKGLSWLIEHQLENGGWGQGEESRQMGSNKSVKDIGEKEKEEILKSFTEDFDLALLRVEEFPAVIAIIPPDARVASTDLIHPRFTHYRRSYDYSDYPRAVNENRPGAPPDTDYIVIDKQARYSKITRPDEVREYRERPLD